MAKGWHRESRRHSLASRGVKTKEDWIGKELPLPELEPGEGKPKSVLTSEPDLYVFGEPEEDGTFFVYEVITNDGDLEPIEQYPESEREEIEKKYRDKNYKIIPEHLFQQPDERYADLYEDKVDSIIDKLMGSPGIPILKEDEFIAVKDDYSIHVFDTKQKKVFEHIEYDKDPDDMIYYGAKDGFKFATTPSAKTIEYLKPGEYEKRYKKYLGE